MFLVRPRRLQPHWHWWLRLAIIVGLVVGIPMGSTTFTRSQQVAQAGTCFARSGVWNMRGAEGGPGWTVGRASFGATICLTNGEISSVSPWLSGDVEGAGGPAGDVWTVTVAAHVVSQNSHRAVFEGTSTLKECAPLFHSVPCSLTITQSWRGYVDLLYGPYPPGYIANALIPSERWCSKTGCHTDGPSAFVRIA